MERYLAQTTYSPEQVLPTGAVEAAMREFHLNDNDYLPIENAYGLDQIIQEKNYATVGQIGEFETINEEKEDGQLNPEDGELVPHQAQYQKDSEVL